MEILCRSGIKYLALISFLTILPGVMFSQSKFHVGPTLGTSIRMLSGNESNDVGFGSRIGIISRLAVNDHFSVLPSLTYARKGYCKYLFSVMFPNGISNEKLNYLDLQIPVKYKVANAFTIQAGFQAGMLLKATYTYDKESYTRFKTNIKDDLNPIDLGYFFGLGFQFTNGLGLDFIMNQGVKNIYKNGLDQLYLDPEFNIVGEPELDGKNRSFSINLYYLIGYKSR